MAVDPNWLQATRMKNRETFGMAGLGQGGAQGIAATLETARAARADRAMSNQERAAMLRAQQALASDPRSAAILALPKIEIPEVEPIPPAYLIAGGLLIVGLFGLILWRSK